VLLQFHHPAQSVRSLLFGAAWIILIAAARAGTAEASSPRPEVIAARDAWRLAEALTAAKPDHEILLGRGGSMLPLYPDGTVLVVQRLPMAELRAGMTVVFIGDRGRPVAHALVEKTFFGWLAKGLNNAEADRTRVRTDNYLGTVVRAFTPVIGIAPALESAASGQ
jgi:hypothetical protein